MAAAAAAIAATQPIFASLLTAMLKPSRSYVQPVININAAAVASTIIIMNFTSPSHHFAKMSPTCTLISRFFRI